MHIRPLVILLLLLLSVHLSAQKEDYQWALGSWGCPTCYYRFFYDFNTDPPNIVLREDSLSTSYHAASISDHAGNILAYSNGLRILNAAGQVIENSTGLNPNALQSPFDKSYPVPKVSFFLQKPDNDTILYYIHLDFDHHPNPSNTYGYIGRDLRLTTINLAANNGAGKVISKNEVLISGVFPIPLAVRHANGRDWWVFISDADENKHYRFLLSPQGFTGPWVQEIGTKPSPVGIGATLGNAFSPSGDRYIDFNVYTGFSIFDFDRCTGLLSNEQRVNYINHPSTFVSYGEGGGVEFSPSNRYLYVTLAKNRAIPGISFPEYVQPYLLQYDLDAPDLQSAGDTLNYIPDTLTTDNYLGVEKILHSSYGADGRIYIVYKGGGFCTIRYPNLGGTDCNFRYYDPFFANSVTWGLPNMPNYRLGPVDGSSCDTLGIDNIPVAKFRVDDTLGVLGRLFYDLSYYEPATWQWSFGDGSVSQDTSPVHVYAQPGIYQVCLIVTNANGTDTLCRQVYVGVTAVQPTPDVFIVKVFPNPVSGELHIESAIPMAENTTLVLLDIQGREVSTVPAPAGATDMRFSVAHLPPGTYVLLGRTPQKVLFWKKIAVQR